MNFFKAQDKARRNTKRLIFLFVLAVISLVILTNILFIGTFAYMGTGEAESFVDVFIRSLNQDVVIVISIGVSLLIFLGSIYKVSALSKGGQAIAEMLGGQLIPQSTTTPEQRKLLNIVEEMSIAAGMPIPKVYLLDESSINAFAAGQSHSNAVIGVTRGALSQLSRDELQGVIAHEFSHILNGDMKLNLRLIGILHGILLIGILGEYALRSMRYSSSNKKDGGGAIIFIGIGLLVIGYAGTFFGKWIKASVSRQREFLADASAVQYTRNKDTIAGALKKIGGLDEGSLLETPSASEYSHGYFASGVSVFLESMFATHPPLEDRIKQIDPGWNGRFIAPKIEEPTVDNKSEEKDAKSPLAGLAVTAAILSSAEQVINNVGTLSENSINIAHQLIDSIPDNLIQATHDPYSARAVIYAVLVHAQPSEKDKNISWGLLEKHADKNIPELSKELYPEISKLDDKLKLPLLELCIVALRELSINQYKQFKHTVNEIIIADKSVDLNEWVIQRLVLQQLDEHFSLRKPAKAKHAYLGAVKSEAETLMSLLAYVEHKEEKQAKYAFDKGKKEIGASAFKIIAREELALSKLNSSLDALMQLKPVLKARVLKSFAVIILADNKATTKGIEIFRTIALCLETPTPLSL
jgi:Zn-dependent protease with chaperone function